MISPLRYVISLTKRSKLTIITVAIVVMFVTATLVIVYSFEMSNEALVNRFEAHYYVIASSDNILDSRVNVTLDDAAYIWIASGKVDNVSTYLLGIYDPHDVLRGAYSCAEGEIILGKDLNMVKTANVELNGNHLNMTVDRRVSFSFFPDYWAIVNYTYFSHNAPAPNFVITNKKVDITGYKTMSMTSLPVFYEKTAEEVSFDLFLLDLISIVVIYLFINALLTIEIKENTKKIAILRAIGSPKSNIAALYLLRGTYIGIAGMIIGFSLGVALSYLLAAIIPLFGILSYFSIYIPPVVFLANLLIAVMGSLIATISPIRNALKIKIVSGMKGASR